MRGIGQYVTKRVAAWAIIVALAAIFGTTRAHAQASDVYSCGTNAQWTQANVPAHCTQGVSMAQCVAARNETAAQLSQQYPNDPQVPTGCAGTNGTRCRVTVPGKTDRDCAPSSNGSDPFFFYKFGTECPNGLDPNRPDGCAQTEENCAAKASSTGTFTPPNGSTDCNLDNCQAAYYYNGDGTSTRYYTGAVCDGPQDEQDDCAGREGYYWHPTLNVCAPIEEEDCQPGLDAGSEGICKKPDLCPEGLKEDANGLCKPEKDTCPAGQIKSPEGSCLPGEGQCAAGETRGDDGTCKKDSDGDGEADEGEDDGTFSGGEDCNAPPQCSGDNILCGQARIQWRIDCNTRKDRDIQGGSCGSPPICVGQNCDALEYAGLLQQWRTACHLEKLLAAEGDTGGGDGNAALDRLATEAQGLDGSDGNPGTGLGDLWADEDVSYSSDESGFGFGTSCPVPPDVSFGTLDWSGLCTLMGWVGLLVLAMAHMHALYIFMGD